MKRRIRVVHLLADVLRIDYAKSEVWLWATCNYWCGMARSVWIASPVSHANPVVTAAR